MMSFSSTATPGHDSDRAEPTPLMSVADMIEAYEHWGVPHFQRGSVWGPSNVAALLESLYYDTPCGTIILWRPENIDQHGVPFVEANTMSHLIVDGQQPLLSGHNSNNGNWLASSISSNLDATSKTAVEMGIFSKSVMLRICSSL
jgi:hypothetical protein